MGVSDNDLLDLEAEFGEAAGDAAHFVAGIDDDGFPDHLVAKDGAVALQRADWKALKDHGSIVALRMSGFTSRVCGR